MKKIFFSIALFAGMAANSFAQTADDVINQYFATVGGKDKFAALKSIKTIGSAEQMGMAFPLVMYAKAPNKMLVEVDVQGTKLIANACDGTTSWYKNPFAGGDKPQKFPAEESAEYLETAQFPDILLNYSANGHKVEMMADETIEGVSCRKMRLLTKSGGESHYFFDKESNVLIMSRSFIRSGEGKGKSIDTYYSDYQEVKGLMFPFSVSQKMEGELIMTSNVKSIELDAAIEDSIFAFPGN